MAIFNAGDLVRICLNPTAGKEQQGEMRPCLVLSPRAFNNLGLTYVAPITQGGNYARYAGFAVTLMGTGSATQGVVLMNAVRSVDLNVRKAEFIEKVPSYVLDEALAKLDAIFAG